MINQRLFIFWGFPPNKKIWWSGYSLYLFCGKLSENLKFNLTKKDVATIPKPSAFGSFPFIVINFFKLAIKIA